MPIDSQWISKAIEKSRVAVPNASEPALDKLEEHLHDQMSERAFSPTELAALAESLIAIVTAPATAGEPKS